jgi:hypothetical protein
VTYEKVYNIPQNTEINMLTNKKCNDELDECKFTISELEVWGVSFKK